MASPGVVLRFLDFIAPLRGKNRWGKRTKRYARRMFTQIAIARLVSSAAATSRARKPAIGILRELRDVMITVRAGRTPTQKFLRWLARKVPILATVLAGYTIARTVHHVRALIVAARGGPEES